MESDQVKWVLTEDKLGKLRKRERNKLRKADWSSNDTDYFRLSVDDIVEDTTNRVAPLKLQYGGFILATIICIAATVTMTISNGRGDLVLGGLLLFALGLIGLGAAFWYRDQLQQRKWKKIAQELSSFFKEQSVKWPGMQFEFHIRGHHKKKGEKGEDERTSVWYERYIILTLPPEDYEPKVSKRMSFRPGTTRRTMNESQDFNGYSAPPELRQRVFEDDHSAVAVDGVVLPYWWIESKDKEGRVYYINNYKKTTQWKPPTEKQLAFEKEEMNKVLPPPAFDVTSDSKAKFEEIKRRSIVKKQSLIEIGRGNKPPEEALVDVKKEDRPDYDERKAKRSKKRSRKNKH